jgi:hypothetical protein
MQLLSSFFMGNSLDAREKQGVPSPIESNHHEALYQFHVRHNDSRQLVKGLLPARARARDAFRRNLKLQSFHGRHPRERPAEGSPVFQAAIANAILFMRGTAAGYEQSGELPLRFTTVTL